MVISVVKELEITRTETFIRAHLEQLPAETNLIHGVLPCIEGEALEITWRPVRLAYQVGVRLGLTTTHRARTRLYRHLLRRVRADVVLAQFGTAGVAVMDACRCENLPLIVYFRGYDASQHSLVERLFAQYQQLFAQAAAIVAVSQHMRQQLIEWGADPQRVYYAPSGVDCEKFTPASFSNPRPTFLFVGRFVDKKAPHLLLLAFAKVLAACPRAELRMIGSGPLRDSCRDLAKALGISHAVTFLGSQPHQVVVSEMHNAWAYVQHSLTAHSGDSEGMPISILEAGACGLPVVSTYHAGIPEAVVHGKTGLLVDERDVNGMADHMVSLATDREHARTLGRAARKRVTAHFDMKQSIHWLWCIIESVTDATAPPVPRVPEWVEDETNLEFQATR